MTGFRPAFAIVAAIAAAAAAPSRAASCRADEGFSFFDNRKFPEARRALEPCAATDAKADLYLGRSWLAERDFDRAIPPLERAAALDPKSAEALLWLGRAYAQKAQNANVFQQASLAGKIHRAFDRAASLEPDNLDAKSALIDFYLLAPGVMGGSVAKAREEAGQIRRRDALRGYQAFGHIAEHEKRFDLAAAEYERAASEFPRQREPYLWRANLAALQKQNARAFDILESLAKAQPADPTVDFAIGRFAAQTGERLDRAEECLKRYLDRLPQPAKDQPPRASAHYQLGVVYDKRGDHDAARREWQESLRLEPGFAAAKEALAK